MKKLKEKPMSRQAPMYIYATEMVGEYYKKLIIKNKKILTVCGSGDQVLNTILLGAKKVVGFDLNKNSEFILNLKIAAIKTLDFDEFIKFFGKNSADTSLDYSLYKKMKSSLDKRSSNFFDKLYKKYNFDGKRLKKSNHFRQRDYFRPRPIKMINLYLKNKRNYKKIRNLLNHVDFSFIQSNVNTLAENKKLSGQKFDIINLSNVPNYFTSKFQHGKKGDPVEYVIKNIFLNLKNKLHLGGKMFYYSYSEKIYPNRIARGPAPISRKDAIGRIKNVREFNMTKKTIMGFNKGTKDMITVLQRVR